MSAEIKAAIDEMNAAWKAFHKSNEEKTEQIFDRLGALESDMNKLGMSGISPGNGGGQHNSAQAPRFLDAKTGEPIRALTSKEEWPAAPSAGVDIGTIVRAAVTGDWRKAESIRDQVTSVSDPDGGFLLPDTVSNTIIRLVRNRMALNEAGATTIPMEWPTLRIVAVDQGPTAKFRAPGDEIGESDVKFRMVNLNARSIAGIVRVDREMIEDASNLGQVLQQELAAALAEEMDRAALFGYNGSNADDALNSILGLKPSLEQYASGQINTDGGALNYDKLSQQYHKLLADNVPSDGISVITAPAALGTLERLKATTDGQYLIPPASISRMQMLPTAQVPVTSGSPDTADVVLGAFADSVIGLRTNVQLSIASEGDNSFKRNQVLVRAIMRVDFAPTRMESFRILDSVEI